MLETLLFPSFKIFVLQEFLSSNPMFETTQVRQKMAAFARYSVQKEKNKELGNPAMMAGAGATKQEDFFSEVQSDQ